MNHADRAEAFFDKGFNCAQAVFAALAPDLGMDERMALKVASGLGGGLGHSGEVCGAALGMCMAAGLANGYDDEAQLADPAVKQAHSAQIKALMDTFRTCFGATGCDDLREVGNRAVCVPYVRRAVEWAAAQAGLNDGAV